MYENWCPSSKWADRTGDYVKLNLYLQSLLQFCAFGTEDMAQQSSSKTAKFTVEYESGMEEEYLHLG